ncbi:MAG: PrgI family protein [archaeon]
MAYEIPQALKYEEKIILGMTFKQLAYVGVAGLVSVIVFKTPIPLFAKVPIIALLMTAGGALAFLKLDEKALNAFNHFKSPRKMGYMDTNMSSFVGVKRVRDDAIELDDNTIRAVIQVMPINFAIRAEDDRNAIIRSFQKFLNSLDFPVQILVRTVNLNLDSYVEYLRSTVGKKVSKKNQRLKVMLDDYCDFLEKYVNENAVQDRLFYLIIPGRRFKDEKDRKAKLDELGIRAQVCREGLATAGLRSNRLRTEQVVPMLASFFGGHVEVGNEYLFPITLFEKYEEGKNAG